jgi:hypothetical protein
MQFSCFQFYFFKDFIKLKTVLFLPSAMVRVLTNYLLIKLFSLKGRHSRAGGNHKVLSEANLNATSKAHHQLRDSSLRSE